MPTSSPLLLPSSQSPRLLTAPPRDNVRLGHLAVQYAEAHGLHLDPWQQLAVIETLARRADGKWSAFEAAYLVARQNGKGAILEAIELAKLCLFRQDRLILHSAHEFKTASEAYVRLKAIIAADDELSKVIRPWESQAALGFTHLETGARLRYVARSRNSTRGFSGDTIILDEAQELSVLTMGAIMPTMSARPNGQLIYTGTVPGEANDAEQWTAVRDRGRAGGARRLLWIEWSPAPPAGDMAAPIDAYDLDDEAAQVAANPAHSGPRGVPTLETMQAERDALRSAPEEFARERLSIWPDGVAGTWNVFTLADWRATHNDEAVMLDPVVMAPHVAFDRKWSAIVAAGWCEDGTPALALVDRQPGTGWVVDRLEELILTHGVSALVLDPGGQTGSLLPDIKTSGTLAGVELVTTSTRDVQQACGALLTAFEQHCVAHFDQPAMRDAFSAGRKRTLGEAFAWRHLDHVDITPLVGASLALWGLTTAPLRGKKKQRTGRGW